MARRSNFSGNVEAFARKCGRTLDQTHRAVTIELFSSVVLTTPVDEGALRGNWNISTGEPDRSTNPNNVDPSGDATVSKIRGHAMKIGDKTYLTNAMPYAEVAEYGMWNGPTDKVTSAGYSRKAPAGMVRKNMARVQAILRKAVASARSTK